MSDTRPVWLTREQRDVLTMVEAGRIGEVADDIIAAWDVAPADAEQAVSRSVRKHFVLREPQQTKDYRCREVTTDVLGALGCPDA